MAITSGASCIARREGTIPTIPFHLHWPHGATVRLLTGGVTLCKAGKSFSGAATINGNAAGRTRDRHRRRRQARACRRHEASRLNDYPKSVQAQWPTLHHSCTQRPGSTRRCQTLLRSNCARLKEERRPGPDGRVQDRRLGGSICKRSGHRLTLMSGQAARNSVH